MYPFTVLMAVYIRDKADLFQVAVESVFNNTILPNEFILIQDGPVSIEVERLIDQFVFQYQIIHIVLAKNVGLSEALNHGLRHVTNDFVFRADADDFNLPHRFELQYPYLLSGYDLVGGTIIEVTETGEQLGFRNVPLEHRDIVKTLPFRSPFNHMTVAFRSTLVKNVGGYPSVHLKEDYALWCLILRNGATACNIPNVLVRATAGIEMYKRRGGLKYVMSEFRIQQYLVRCNYQSIPQAILVGFLRSVVFSMPAMLRGVVYKYILRKRRPIY